MGPFVVAAVQAAYVLMDREATIDRVAELTARGRRARVPSLVVFPEAFVPGTPIWIDSRPIWDGDADWYALLVDQAVVVPGPGHRPPRRDRPGGASVRGRRGGRGARAARGAPSTTRSSTSAPDGALLDRHRKLDADRLRAHGVGHGRRVDAATWSPPRSAGSAG